MKSSRTCVWCAQSQTSLFIVLQPLVIPNMIAGHISTNHYIVTYMHTDRQTYYRYTEITFTVRMWCVSQCKRIFTEKRRLWGLRFGNPLHSAALYVSNGCAWVFVSIGRSFGARAFMFVFPSTASTLSCFKPGRLFIHTGFVYKHCVSVYRAFNPRPQDITTYFHEYEQTDNQQHI